MQVMTTPDTTKQVRVTAETHAALMKLAGELGGTADDAVRHLIGLSTVRVAVTAVQRQRWIAAAQATGVPVDEFVRLRIEACLQFGADAQAIQRIYQDVDLLVRESGLRRQYVNPPSTSRTSIAPSRRRLSTPDRPEATS